MNAHICRVHDPDDAAPGRICGRPLPCRDHGPGPVADVNRELGNLKESLRALLTRHPDRDSIEAQRSEDPMVDDLLFRLDSLERAVEALPR